MTSWRASRFLAVTLTCSPCVWDCTPFRPRSLMVRLTDRALSESMPAWRLASCRDRAPPASSTFPQSSDLSDTLRRTSFSSSTTTRAARRSSVEDSSLMAPSRSSTTDSVPLKSNLVLTSRAAWSTALRTSWRLISDTTSKLGMRAPYR